MRSKLPQLLQAPSNSDSLLINDIFDFGFADSHIMDHNNDDEDAIRSEFLMHQVIDSSGHAKPSNQKLAQSRLEFHHTDSQEGTGNSIRTSHDRGMSINSSVQTSHSAWFLLIAFFFFY